MMRKHLLPVLVMTGLILPGPALACSCMRFDSARDHVDRTAVIFEGVAVETRKVADSPDSSMSQYARRTSFRVTRRWKGKVGETVAIDHSEAVCCICGVAFEPGKSYRIFAIRGNKGRLHTSTCTAPRFDWAEYEAVLTGENTDE